MRIETLPVTVDEDTTVYFFAKSLRRTIGLLRLDPDGFIRTVFVQEPKRGRGVGALLIGAACDWCRSNGRESVGLSVADSNPRARQLYRRLGFVKYMPGHEGYTQFVKVL